MLQQSRGQSVTEFLLVAPLLLVILMATVGFGHLLYARMIVLQAAGSSARLGAVVYGDSSLSKAEARQRTYKAAENILQAGLPGSDYDILIAPGSQDIRVTVTYPYRVFVPLLGALLGKEVPLRHSVIYRIEYDTP